MKRISRVIYSLLAFILLIGCSGGGELDVRLKRAMSEKKGEELLTELYSMDQKYPDKLVLKVNIGAMLLAQGDTEKASVFLKKGEELSGFGSDSRLQATLFANLAELSLRQGAFNKGVEYSDKSLSLNKDDPLGVTFTRAKCLFYANEKAKALSAFDYGWNKYKDNMNKEDMNFYISLLKDNDRYDRAIEVTKEYGVKFDYEPGLGIIESVFYEKLGKVNESIISAAKDLEYARYTGTVSVEDELDRLRNLDKKVNDISWNPKQEGRDTLSGLIFYVSGKWHEAREMFLKVALADDDLPFYRLLVLSSVLESGGAGSGDFEEYLGLERNFRSFPNYYYHLYRGMSLAKGIAGLGDARNAMESAILLAPDTEYALQTRIALGLLLGLRPHYGAKIMLGPELDAVYARLVSGAPPAICDPVLELLATPDNVYELAAVFMLRRARQIPAVADYIEKKMRSADGKLAERLGMVLSR